MSPAEELENQVLAADPHDIIRALMRRFKVETRPLTSGEIKVSMRMRAPAKPGPSAGLSRRRRALPAVEPECRLG